MILNSLFKDPIKVKIIAFFHENPSSIDTPRGVATWIAQTRTVAKKALEELAMAGVLIAHKVSSTTGYSYTQDPKIVTKINRFLKKKSKKLIKR